MQRSFINIENDMAAELERQVIEYMANSVVRSFIDAATTKKGVLSFEIQVDGYNYKIRYKLDPKGKWIMANYTSSLLK
jgi:hypothetical protein